MINTATRTKNNKEMMKQEAKAAKKRRCKEKRIEGAETSEDLLPISELSERSRYHREAFYQ